VGHSCDSPQSFRDCPGCQLSQGINREAWQGYDKGKEMITHQKDVHGCVHNNLKKLVFASLGIHSHVISLCNTHHEAQHVGDLNGAISTLTGWVKQLAIGWKMQLCTEGPRTRPQEL